MHEYRGRTHRIAVALLLLVSLHSREAFSSTPGENDPVTLRFDAIIELNAPVVGSHVVLFARYWVSSDSYSISLVWAEPHVGSMNFPVYPVTLNIDSNDTEFHIANQVIPWAHWAFRKPLDRRAIFRYRFNDYPIENIRFAEGDAQASRVFVSDLGSDAECHEGWATIRISANNRGTGTPRDAAELKVHRVGGEITVMDVLDTKGNVLKNMTYEYSGSGPERSLHRETVVLPPTLLAAGFNDKGMSVKVNGQERTVKEFPIKHHAGGRKCTIDYTSVRSPEGEMALPSRIEVRRNDTGQVLRSVRISNYIRVEMPARDCNRTAKEFNQFDSLESEQRRLLLKYWFASPADVNTSDVHSLQRLGRELEDVSATDRTVGEKLKRTNMLMETDLILGDADRLVTHFKEYLETLRNNQLDTMVLTGGSCRIDTAVQWRQFSAANALLAQWLNVATTVHGPASIMEFAKSQAQHGNPWMTVRLMEASMEVTQWGNLCFSGQALRASILHQIYRSSQGASDIRDPRTAMTVWVVSSLGDKSLAAILGTSIDQANDTFADLDTPTEQDKALKHQLVFIEREMSQSRLRASPVDRP